MASAPALEQAEPSPVSAKPLSCLLYTSYGSQVILENFDFSVEKGEFVTIIGSSGSGKTTVLKMANGLVKADAGDIFINGENIRDKDMICLLYTSRCV